MASSNNHAVMLQFMEVLADICDPNYGRDHLLVALQPSLDLENSFRTWCRGTGAGTGSPNAKFDDPYFGLFPVFAVPDFLRMIHARRENTPITIPASPDCPPAADCTCVANISRFSYYSETANAICSFPKCYMFPLRRALFRGHTTPCMVKDLAGFQENFQIFTHGALAAITNWDNMVVTGGSVVASLGGRPPRDGDRDKGVPWSAAEINEFYQSDLYRTSDVDIFLYGLTIEQAIDKATEIYTAISQSALWPLTVIRKADRISIHTLYPCRPIHIYLDLYQSPAEIMANCDIDCSCCLFDGSKVHLNARGLISFMFQTNRVDLTRWSPSYEVRLAKYAARGFEVYVPFLERERVAYNRIYDRGLTQLPFGLGRLLVLELLSYIPDHLLNLDDEPVRSRVIPDALPHAKTFAPIDKRLANDEDILWAQVPYGPQWDSHSLRTFVESINRAMNHGEQGISRRRLHRHPIYLSSQLSDCVGAVCKDCPSATTKAEMKIMRAEQGLYCQGPLRFYIRHARKASLPGKTNGQRQEQWTAETYLADGQALGQSILKVIPRYFWHNIVLARMAPITWKVDHEGHSDVEGAVPTLVSQFRAYVEIEGFINLLREEEACGQGNHVTGSQSSAASDDSDDTSSDGGMSVSS